jgi:RES domain-containing protein
MPSMSSRKARCYSVGVQVYRVFSFREGVAPQAPGGALYIPPQGRGRVDNPHHYQAYYASQQPEAAVAEVLGAREPGPLQTDSLRGSPILKGSILALATVQIPSRDRLCDLDDPKELISRHLRPSRVITRDYRVSQQWSLVIFQEKRASRWIGVSWWSFYESSWTSVAVWKPSALKLLDVQPLTLEHTAVREAARILRRPIF